MWPWSSLTHAFFLDFACWNQQSTPRLLSGPSMHCQSSARVPVALQSSSSAFTGTIEALGGDAVPVDTALCRCCQRALTGIGGLPACRYSTAKTISATSGTE